MPRFLDTLGNADIAIAICDRCHFKRPHSVMRNDFNFPGLLVCDQGCMDQKDPYRLAPRPTERITIRFPRPDTNIDVDDNNLVTAPFGGQVLSPEQNVQTPQNNGNFDSLTRQP